MYRLTHTYGPTCELGRHSAPAGPGADEERPRLYPQYFYYSTHDVDDPLSPVPVPTGSESKPIIHPPQPFSVRDNNAIEVAWQGIATDKGKKRYRIPGSGATGNRDSNDKAPNELPPKIAGRGETTISEESTSSLKRSQRSRRVTQTHGTVDSSPCNMISGELKSSKYGRQGDGAIGNVKDEDTILQCQVESKSIDNNVRTGEKSEKGKTASTTLEEEDRFGKRHLEICPGTSTSLNQPEDEWVSSDCERGGQRKDLETQTLDLVQPKSTETCCDARDNISNHFPDSRDLTLAESHSHSLDSSSKSQRRFEDGALVKSEVSDDGFTDSKQIQRSPHQVAVATQHLHPFKHLSSATSAPTTLTQFDGDAGTTGLPFAKLPLRDGTIRPSSSHSNYLDAETVSGLPGNPHKTYCPSPNQLHDQIATQTESVCTQSCSCHENMTEKTVPVGLSRLHLVEVPALKMRPIYWKHIHDTARIIRGTWFYKDTMLPVEASVANQLEKGYRELKPWSQTWSDELNSAVDVGAAGEEKIAHRLWPKQEDDPHDSKRHPLSTDPFCAAKYFPDEASAEGTCDLDNRDENSGPAKSVNKKYPNAQVIYKDGKNAFLLKPTLQPSAYYGRKPLQKIRRNWTVGIHCVRGFERREWEKLHPSKSPETLKHEAKVPVSGDADANANVCPACRSREELPNVTDLCLVIHGIGQKLSERVDSFNFTHACNSVRRAVNVELATETVKQVLRRDLGGIMVLPINWRSLVTFEEVGSMTDGGERESSNGFTLKDITPDTIPAVRNMISDVMFDIPYYMTQHTNQKMVQAVVAEANRVYRLWCQNNPSFHNHGRVHLIAHSLGSAMAFEILSKQPTHVSNLDLQSTEISSKHFDFNTTNLFCAGSPCGFFLHLKRAVLTPRRGRMKAGGDREDDRDNSIVGEVGDFGCLAVDNIYNIMHCNDPVAYRLNPTVDTQYAASLKEARVPSASIGFFQGIGNAIKGVTPGIAGPSDLAVGQVSKPIVTRLPSQLEMEIHDFTREEVAEKKFYLLNDNCQIDWTLSPGGHLAYVDMLGAHSSYWERKDFVRLLVTEIGRDPGKKCTLPNMRAVKVSHKS